MPSLLLVLSLLAAPVMPAGSAVELGALAVAPPAGALETLDQGAPICEAEDSSIVDPLQPLEPVELSCTAPDCSGCQTQGGFQCECYCNAAYLDCNAGCGQMDFQCQMQCEQQQNSCVDCCYTWENSVCN